MKKNIGTIDRLARVALAIIVVALYYKNVIGGTAAAILLVVAGALILTSFVSYCPLYAAFGFNTLRKKTS